MPKGRFRRSDRSPSGAFLARRVPGAASRARTSEEKNDRGAEEQLVEDPTRPGPMARRIFIHFLKNVELSLKKVKNSSNKQ